MPLGAGSVFESSYVYGQNRPFVFVDPSGLRGTLPFTPNLISSAKNDIRPSLSPGLWLTRAHRGDIARFSRIMGVDPRLAATILLHENDFPNWGAYSLSVAKEDAVLKAQLVGVIDGNTSHLGLANLKLWDADVLKDLALTPNGPAAVEAVLGARNWDFRVLSENPSGRMLHIESNHNDTLSIALLVARLAIAQKEALKVQTTGKLGPTINGAEVSITDRLLLGRFIGSGNALKSSYSGGEHDPAGAIGSVRKYWGQADSTMCGGGSCA